jgi:beta-lactamase class A
MRLSPPLAGLIVFAALAAGCVAATPPAGETPAAQGHGSPRPGSPTPRAGSATPEPAATAEGRLPPQPLAPTAQPHKPAGLTLDASLQKRIEDALGDSADHYGVYVKDLRTGRGAALNADRVFNAASLFKAEVMYEVFRQRNLGLLSFDEVLEVTPYYAAFDLGTRPQEVGDRLSIGDALKYMMSLSDNVSAVLLQDRVGAGNVNATMASLGLTASGLFTDGIPATAEDFGVLMEALYAGTGMDLESREAMLDLLASETFDNGIVAGVPRGTWVGHKTGNWTDATNDAGIVIGPSGPYVIVVLCDLDHETAGTKAVSEAVFRYLNPGA